MVADANQYLSNTKETNFVHGIRRTMKAAFPLIICVGCLTIFQNNSLGNLTFTLILFLFCFVSFSLQNCTVCLKYSVILNGSYVKCCCSIEKCTNI